MVSDIERNRIHGQIEKEYVHSLTKHGNWDDCSLLVMLSLIQAELDEAYDGWCRGDYTGQHGVYAELSQVAACCQKAMVQIIRRNDLKGDEC